MLLVAPWIYEILRDITAEVVTDWCNGNADVTKTKSHIFCIDSSNNYVIAWS